MKMHFTIGEGITNLIRDIYWFENEKERALNILKTFVGITDNQIKSILNGDAYLKPIENGDRVEFTKYNDKEFKEKLKQHKKFIERMYITIMERRVKRDTFNRYADFVVKRLRDSIRNTQATMMMAKCSPAFADTLMNLEFERQELHKEILLSAGFKMVRKQDSPYTEKEEFEETEEYLKFNEELGKILDKRAGTIYKEEQDERENRAINDTK